MATTNEFRILQWNANGIRYKTAELINLIKRLNIHCVCLCETRLNAQLNFWLPGFKIFRRDGEPPERGVLLAIREELNPIYHQLPELGHLESVAATVSSPHGQLIIASTYNSPSRARPLERSALSTLLGIGSKLIISGDLNARHSEWGCRRENNNGRTLHEMASRRNLNIVFPAEPTRYPSNTNAIPSTLDLLVIKGMPNIESTAISLHELNSDHNPVFTAIKKPIFSNRKFKWDLQRADWTKYRTYICEHLELTPIGTIDQLETAVSNLTNIITEAANYSIPKKPVSSFSDPLPEEISKLIVERNRARRSWQRHRIDTSRTEMNRLSKTIKIEIAKWRQKAWINRITKLTHKNCSLWEFSKRLRRRKNTIGPLSGPNGLEYSPLLQTTLLANSFKQQFTNNEKSKLTDSILKRRVARALELRQEETIVHRVKPKEVQEAIRKIKTRKAPGPDGILPIFIKSLPGKARLFLAWVFESMLNLSHFPSTWKHAEIIPIPKAGKEKTDPSNYRPISLLPVLGKLAEHFILKWLERETYELELLPKFQFGFRKTHSAVHQIARVHHFIKNRLRVKKATGMVLLDIAKAFDSVPHLPLAAKLFLLGLPEPLCQLIGNFLLNRSFRVRIDNNTSDWHPINAGVPQGALLSPLLYILYTSDIPKLEFAQIAQFADDTAIYYSNKNFTCLKRRLQEETTIITRYFKKWRLKINPNKSEAILFTNKRKYLHTTLAIDSHTLKWLPKVRYLGAIMDRRTNWAAHVKTAAAKGQQAISILWPLIKRNSPLPIPEKLMLYKTIIRTTIAYAAPVWFPHISRSNLLRLERIQSKSLRTIADPPPGINNCIIRVGLNVDSLEEHLNMVTSKFITKSRAHDNSFISDLFSTS